MSSDGKPLPPPDLRFDTSDTAAAPVSRNATLPVVAAAGDRSRPLVVKIPPKPMARGSEAEMQESDAEGAASLAAGSILSAAPPASVPPVAAARAASDAVAAKRGFERIKLPRVSKRYEAVSPVASSTSRRLVIGSAAVAGTCLAVALGAIVWARSSGTRGGTVAASRKPDAPAVAQAKAPRAEAPVVAPEVAVVAPEVAVVAPEVAVVAPEVAVVAPEVAVVAPEVVEVETCSLDVRANVTDAVVWIDGKRIGAAPATFAAACNAIANVEVRHPRYATFAEAVTLDAAAPGGITTRTVQLVREKTTLTLTSEPAGAQVTYNGSVLGKTPLVVKVPRFEQGMVVFSAPNHASDWRKIVPSKETKTVSIKLKGMILRPGS
jgi:hypothetical protein